MGTCIPVGTTKRWLRQLCGGSGSSSASMQRESPFEKLPTEIVHHIHSLLPVKDAARAACVSRSFLCSWRCYSNLTLSMETLGSTRKKYRNAVIFPISIVDRILEKHLGNGVEIFRLDVRFCENIDASDLDRWLQIVVNPVIKELSLVVPSHINMYNFPYSVFSDEAAASSIQFLDLQRCAFCPAAPLGCFRRLRRLRLCSVDITDEGLGHLLSKSSALEQMDILNCRKIICLRIPRTLQKLTILRVGPCDWLRSVDINAPKLSTFYFVGTLLNEISVVNPWQLKDVKFTSYPYRTLSFACASLLALARNVESLTLFSPGENFNTAMLISMFPGLKKLEISIQRLEPALTFDVLSLVSFLDASPALDSFIMRVGKDALRHDDSIVGGDNAEYLRCKPQCRYDCLRQVMITGFRSNKNLIQLVIYIVESAPSLECLTLATTPGYPRKFGIIGKKERCSWMSESSIAEAQRAVKDVNRYIAERVPSGVRFQVVEPCSLCHSSQKVVNRWQCGLF